MLVRTHAATAAAARQFQERGRPSARSRPRGRTCTGAAWDDNVIPSAGRRSRRRPRFSFPLLLRSSEDLVLAAVAGDADDLPVLHRALAAAVVGDAEEALGVGVVRALLVLQGGGGGRLEMDEPAPDQALACVCVRLRVISIRIFTWL